MGQGCSVKSVPTHRALPITSRYSQWPFLLWSLLHPCPNLQYDCPWGSEAPLSEGDAGRYETSNKDQGRLEKTARITLTPIITYKSNVSATRQALGGLRFCLFSPTDSYLQVATSSSQAWAQVATGWSPIEADGRGRHNITRGLQRSKLYICPLGSMTVGRKDCRSLTC